MSDTAQEFTGDHIQRLLRNAGKQRHALRPEYQELKFTLHRKLLDKINLEALATIDNQRVPRNHPGLGKAEQVDCTGDVLRREHRSCRRTLRKVGEQFVPIGKVT